MPPTVTTDAPSNVTATGATLNGSVTLNDDTDGSYTFTWGTSTSGTGLGSSGGTVTANSTDAPVTASISSLSPATTYYYQLCATNTFDTACDTVQQLTTLPAAPDATTGSGTPSTTATSATLNGTVNPNGDATTFVFYYDTTSHAAGSCGDYASSTASGSAGSGTSATPVSKTLTSLSANTTYYFRLSASNNEGTTCSTVESSFTTPNVPAAVTGSATSVSTSGATLNGTVNPQGSNVTSTVFKYCTGCANASSGSTIAASPSPGSGTSPVSVSATLSGLQSGATFHYMLCATNAYGTSCGSDQTFATDTPPTAVLTENKTAPGPGAVSFNGSGSSDPDPGDSITWSLDFGDGSHQTGSGTPGSAIQHTYAGPGSYTAKLTVTDSHGASTTSSPVTVVVPSISVANLTQNEGNSGTTNFLFVVTLSAISTHDVTVNYATADGTAQAGSDYTSESGTLTIPAGTNCTTSPATNSLCQIVVPVTGDTIYEHDETFALNLSNPTGATLVTTSATGTILNDDQPPKVMIDNGATLEGNTGSVIGAGHSWSGGNLQVNDASGFPSSFGAHTFYISTPGSPSVGGPYTYTGVSGNTLTGVSPASGTVAANQIAFQPRTITLAVVLCDPQLTKLNDPADCVATHSGLDTTVNFASSDGRSITTGIPVVEGQDYVENSGTLTIPAGQGSADITYQTIPNTTPENPQNPGDDLTRWFNVLISNAMNGTIVSNLGTAKIIEDDGLNPPTATTGPASSIGADHATVSATVNPNSDATSVYVQYGPTDSYGSQTATQSLPAGTSDQSLTFTLTGLSPGTLYHYQVVAMHADNSTGYGQDLTFTTDVPPTAVLAASPTSGPLPLTVTFNGSGSSDSGGSIASWKLDFGDGNSASGTGSVPSAIKHKYTSKCSCSASLTVTDNDGVQSGPATVVIDAGKTPPPPVTGKNPILSTYTTTVLGPTSAKIVFPVDPNGAPTNAWVEYGKTSPYGQLSKAVAVPAGAKRNVTITLTGLTPSTLYHYRLVAVHTTDSGAAYSQYLPLKTPKAKPMFIALGPKVVRATPTGLVPLTFSCKGNTLPSCKGQALLELGNTPVGFKSFSVPKGKRRVVSVPLKKTLLRRLLASTALHLDLSVSVRTGMKGTPAPTTQTITLLPPLKAKPKH